MFSLMCLCVRFASRIDSNRFGPVNQFESIFPITTDDTTVRYDSN